MSKHKRTMLSEVPVIPAVQLKDFIRGGKSRYVCINTRLRCLNMGSDDVRECNAPHLCPWKRRRLPVKQEGCQRTFLSDSHIRNNVAMICDWLSTQRIPSWIKSAALVCQDDIQKYTERRKRPRGGIR